MKSEPSFKEADLRAYFRKADRFPEGTVWLGEPGVGSDLGLPDIWILARPHTTSFFVPLELKRGVNPVVALRPSQRRFHRNCARREVATFLLTQISDNVAHLYAIEEQKKQLVTTFGKQLAIETDLNYAMLSSWINRTIRIMY